MTVRIQKDSINLREKLSELDKPSGIAGQDILKADTPQEVFNYINAGRRNLIINGGMQVWQRGTSFSSTNGSCTVDRFKVASGVGTASQSTDVPDGFKYSLYIQSPTTGYTIRHIIEDSYRLLSTNAFTISFYIKGDSAFTGEINVNDGTSQTYSVTTDWTRVSKTFSALTSTSAAYGTENDYFDICDGASVNYKVTGVQLEVGSVATPFEHRSYGEELALCQRFFQLNNTSTGLTTSTTSATFAVQGFVEMRATPSFSVFDGTTAIADIGTASRTLNSITTTYQASKYGAETVTSISTSTNAKQHLLKGGKIAMDAEL